MALVDVARKAVERSASGLLSSFNSLPSLSLSLSIVTRSASQDSNNPQQPLDVISRQGGSSSAVSDTSTTTGATAGGATAATTTPTTSASTKRKLRWSRNMAIRVPLYRAALLSTSHSIKMTRQLVAMLPTFVPENTSIEPTTVPRDQSLILPNMTRDQAQGSVPAEWHRCTSPSVTSTDTVILYLHGGAFFMGSPATHRPLTAKLAELTGATVLSLDYRLAPENPFPLPLHDAISAYNHLVRNLNIDPTRIVLAGDSAGGGLALSLAIHLRDTDNPIPAGVLAMAPWCDLTHSQPSFTLNADTDYLPPAITDPLLSAATTTTTATSTTTTHRHRRSHAYTAADHLNTDPLVSPLFARSEPGRRMPPVLVQVGERERLRDEGILTAARSFARDDGFQCEVYEDMVHVFQVFGCDVGRNAMRRAADFVRGVVTDTAAAVPETEREASSGFVVVGVDGSVRDVGRQGLLRMVDEGRRSLEAQRGWRDWRVEDGVDMMHTAGGHVHDGRSRASSMDVAGNSSRRFGLALMRAV